MRRRVGGAVLVLASLLGTAWLHRQATDFPTAEPLAVVDSALLDSLRSRPGLHLALAPDYELRAELELVDDPLNRFVYGTDVDLREQRPTRSIHIQVKDGRGAIHADGHNPTAGVLAWVVHATWDVPFLPFPVLGALGLFFLSGWGGALTPAGDSARGRGAPGAPPGGPPPPRP